MATTYINDGDTVIFERRQFKVVKVAGEPELTSWHFLCEACRENDASEYEFEGHLLCPRCIEDAMEMHVYARAVQHLMDNDSAARKVFSIMDYYDDRQGAIQHVDFHSSSVDYMWALDEDELDDVLNKLTGRVRNLITNKVLLER